MAYWGSMHPNSRSTKVTLNAPKARRIKETMYGMLVTPRYTITSVGRVVYHNPEKAKATVRRYIDCVKQLKVEGYCGVKTWGMMLPKHKEAPKLYGNIGKDNLVRLAEIQKQLGL